MSNGRKLLVFATQAHRTFAKAICDRLDVPLGESHTIRFSNENLMVQVDENVREADVFVIHTMAPPVNDGIMELLIFLDALKHASAARVTAVVPCFPYARSDKKDKPRISIAARLMADLLETAGADRVLTMDLHSPQIQGFFRIPADQLRAAGVLCDHFRATTTFTADTHVLVAGDAGEAKELGRYANRLGLPMAIVDKRRYGDDEKPKAAHVIGDVKGRHCILVDDEVASGATLVEAAKFLVEKAGAASVEAMVVHPVLSGSAVSRLGESPIGRLIATDTVPTATKNVAKLELVSVAPLFANAIRRIHSGESVSELFE